MNYEPSKAAIEEAAYLLRAYLRTTLESCGNDFLQKVTAAILDRALAIDGPRIRDAALEDAAKIADDEDWGSSVASAAQFLAARVLAAEIRALKEASK